MLEVRQLAGVVQHAQMAVLVINRYSRFIRMVNIVNEGSHKAVYGIIRLHVLLLQALPYFRRVTENVVDAYGIDTDAVINYPRHLLRRKQGCRQQCNTHYERNKYYYFL